MELEEEWEQALDVIADAARVTLKADSGEDGRTATPPCARIVRGWMEGLTDLLVERQRECDLEGVSEVLDVVASVLQASVDARWRQRREEQPDDDDGIYCPARLETIIQALTTAVTTDSEDIEDVRSQVVRILSSLLLGAAPIESAMDIVLDLLRRGVCTSPLLETIFHADQISDNTVSAGSTWALCFLRFALLFVSSSSETSKDDLTRRTTLSALTGIGEDAVGQWVETTWETKWHLHRSSQPHITLMGSEDECVACIRRMFDGFSIALDDAASSSRPTEASTVVGVRDAHKHIGLVHGVDVTFIKNGQVHPDWKETNRQVRIEDVDAALTNGYSVGVRGMQARSLSVFNLCDNLQRELGQHVNANLYWTPPGQQGFDLHIDDHCVFAMQLKGRKRWVLYKPCDDVLPRLYENTVMRLATGPPQVHCEIVLEEGDILYVPRGVAHHADTKGIDEESIHLTIGVEIEAANTNARVLEELEKRYRQVAVEMGIACSERSKSRGLMAWHLASRASLSAHISSITGVQPHDDLNDSLDTIRATLGNEREVFLAGRSCRARAMATLHEAARSTYSCQRPNDVDIECSLAKKKQRQ